MASLFDIGKSGLTSYRQALTVTGQNIANINTEGYKRRAADLQEVVSGKSGLTSTGLSAGLGVRVDDIRRAFDGFLLNKARTATSYANSTSTYSDTVKTLEDTILPGEGDIGAVLGSFFMSLQEVAAQPNDLGARTVALEQARYLAGTFVETSGRVTEYMGGVALLADQQSQEVNLLTAELANVNFQLMTASGSKSNNSLLDSRDAIIDKISEYVQVVVEQENNGSVTLTLGDNSNGPKLVELDRATKLGARPSGEALEFVLGPGGSNILTSQVVSGSLHGLANAYALAGGTLDEIDHLAFTFVNDINEIQGQGLTLDGGRGDQFFSEFAVDITANLTNSSGISAEVDVTDISKVSPDRVEFTYDKAEDMWLGRSRTGDIVASGRTEISLPGLTVKFVGTADTFDSFVLNPVRGKAASVSVALSRPEDIAAASPLLVAADAQNRSAAIAEVTKVSDAPSDSLQSIEDLFSNNRSAVAATEFLTGGPVSYIPARATEVEIFSLARQSSAHFSVSKDDLGNASRLSLEIVSAADDGEETSRTIDFDVSYNSVKQTNGQWPELDPIADLLNLGAITGTDRSTGDRVSLSELGGFVSAKDGNMVVSLTADELATADLLLGGRSVQARIDTSIAEASDIRIFTREGRHVAGTAGSPDEIASWQTMMTVENGFNAGASYVDDYLNSSAEDGYLGINVATASGQNVLTDISVADGKTNVAFRALEGIDTNEASISGLRASARTVNYEMTVGDLSATVTQDDIQDFTDAGVARAIIDALRGESPISSMIGSVSTADDGDSVELSFEGQRYTLSIVEGETLISGGEEGRLEAFLDENDRVNVFSTSGSVSRSSIDVVADNSANIDAARRFGLMQDLAQPVTRYSDALLTVPSSGNASTDNIVTLTFDQPDTYSLRFTFDQAVDFGDTATTDKEFTVEDVVMQGGDASAVATAINAAVAANATEDDGGADLSGLVSAQAVGNTVRLTVGGGMGAEIVALDGEVSAGTGTVAVSSYTSDADVVESTAALQLEEGGIYAFKVNGTAVTVDTSTAGQRASSDGTLSGAITDAVNAIQAAIESTSGAGTATINASNSVVGDTIMFDMTDASGNQIVISDFQNLERDFLPAGHVVFSPDIEGDETVTIRDTEYLTQTLALIGEGLTVAAGSTARLEFSSNTQYYQFNLDVDADGVISERETFTIDGITADFDEEVTRVANEISTIGGDDITAVNNGGTLEISNGLEAGNDLVFDRSVALVSDPQTAVGSATAFATTSPSTDTDLTDDADVIAMSAGSYVMSGGGMIASATIHGTLGADYQRPDFDLRLENGHIAVVPDDGSTMPAITAQGDSLAKQSIRLSDLPSEDLIVVVGDVGARRVSMQYDLLPTDPPSIHRDVQVRVSDLEQGIVEFVDSATSTSIATRILDDARMLGAMGFEISFTGDLAEGDLFHINDNGLGVGDNRNLDRMLRLQTGSVSDTTTGDFQNVLNAAVIKLGAAVQAGNIAADTAESLRAQAVEAEAAYSGVTLDNEASNLIEQQQAYQASARVLSTAREIFETLLQSL